MSTIHFIGGEKGGVGKSVVARLCAQYCIDRQLPFLAADADGSHGALMRFYADYTAPIDLDQLPQRRQILGLATDGDRRVIVDLPAQSDRLLGAWLGESGSSTCRRERRQHRLLARHRRRQGRAGHAETAARPHGDKARNCIVKNHGRGKDFTLFDRSPVREEAERLGAAILELPELNPAAMQKIDRLDASFWAAANGRPSASETFTRIEGQRVKVWLTAAYDRLAQLGDLF